MCYFELDEACGAADNTANRPCLNEPVMHYFVMNNLLSREVSASSLVHSVLCVALFRVDAGTFSLRF